MPKKNGNERNAVGRFRLEPYQAADTSGRRYASRQRTYLVSWWSDGPDLDAIVKRALADLGVPVMIQGGTAMRNSYRLTSDYKLSSVVKKMRLAVKLGVTGTKDRYSGPGAHSANPYDAMDFHVKEL